MGPIVLQQTVVHYAGQVVDVCHVIQMIIIRKPGIRWRRLSPDDAQSDPQATQKSYALLLS